MTGDVELTAERVGTLQDLLNNTPPDTRSRRRRLNSTAPVTDGRRKRCSSPLWPIASS